MKTCASCGMANYDDSSFCCGCGKPMDTVPQAVQQAQPVSTPPAEQPPYYSQPNQAAAPAPTPMPSQMQNPVPPQTPYSQNPINPTYAGNPPYAANPANPPYTSGPVNPPYAANQGQSNPANPPYMSSPANPPYTPYTYGAYQQPVGYGVRPSREPADVLQNVKEIVSSHRMLALVIVWFVSCIITVVSGLTSSTAIGQVMNSENMPYITEMSQFTVTLTRICSLFAVIPTALIGIGLLMAYLSARNTKNSPLAMSASGFVIIRVLAIIQIVLTGVAVIFGILVSVLLMSGASGILSMLNSYFSGVQNLDEYASIIGTVIIVFAIIFGAVMITIYAIYLKFIGSVIETIRTGTFRAKCATGVYVLAFIIGGFAALSVFSSLSALAVSPSLAIVGFLSNAAQAGAYILLGTLVYSYKKLDSIYF